MEEGPTHKYIVPEPVNFSDDPDQSQVRHVSLEISCHADCDVLPGKNTHPSPNVTETTLGLLWQQLIRVRRPYGQCYYGISEVGGQFII